MSRQQQQQAQQQETKQPTQSETKELPPEQQQQDTQASAQQQTSAQQQAQTHIQPPPSPPLLPPTQKQGTQDREPGKKWKDCEGRLTELQYELDSAKKDLDRARAKEEPTGNIYAEIHRIYEEIKRTEIECKKLKPVVDDPPDLSVAQNIISTSVVRRKDVNALVR